MISAIQNQPVNFGPSLLEGCICDSIVPSLLVDPDEDQILFQMGLGLCPNEEGQIDNPDFRGVNWKAGIAWTLFPGLACGENRAGATLEDTSLVPVVGESYILRFIIQSVRDTVSWTFGGASGTFGTSGTTTGAFTVDIPVLATATGNLVITLDTDDSAICFNLIQSYAPNRNVVVEIVQGGDVVEDWDPATNPEVFTFTGDVMSVELPIAALDLEGCFTVRVTNECADQTITLESQTMQTTSSDCTLKIRTCNDTAALGFAPTPLEMRLDAKLTHPSYEYELSRERRSNGRILTNYADRQRKMELRIGLQSEWVHPYLSAIPVFSHFYIGQDEYVIDDESYEPLYGDVFDGTAGIVLTVRPKEELFRRVQCEEEGPGCIPPPNLWVQGTGPNNDLVITQTNDSILVS